MSRENAPKDSPAIKTLKLHRDVLRDLRVRTSVKTGLYIPSIAPSEGCSCAVGGVTCRKPPPH